MLLLIVIIFVFLEIKLGDVEHQLQTDMRLHLDLSCVKLNKREEQLRNTQEELHHTQEKLEKFEKITRKLEEKVTAHENKLMQCSEEHTLKISGITKVLRQGSAPFYTRKYGYKFKLHVGLSEGVMYCLDTRSSLSYLSVCFVLMKGVYDAILPWPFNEKVTCTLIDQQENQKKRKNIVGFIPANPDNSSWNQKPVSDENQEKRLLNVFLDEQQKRRFIVDDTIFIQVKIDPN